MGKIDDIAAALIAELNAGKYPAGGHFPSEYELSERFNAGRVTVNKAVSQLVQKGFLERGVRGSGTRVKALTLYPQGHIIYLGKLMHMFCAALVQGIYMAAAYRGYGLEVAMPTGDDMAGFLDKVCASGKYAGIITHGYTMLDAERWPLPTVYVDTCSPVYDPACFHVANRNYEGAKALAGAVIKRGHREVVVYTHSDYMCSHRFYRVNGFMDAFKQHGLECCSERLFVGMEYSMFDASSTLRKIRSRFPQVSVIMTPTDDLALDLVRVLRQQKIDHISVTGFGNVQGISDAYNLASADQHPFHLGSDAANMLMDLAEGKNNQQPHIQYVDVEPVNIEAIPIIKPGV